MCVLLGTHGEGGDTPTNVVGPRVVKSPAGQLPLREGER